MPHSVCPWWMGYLLASPLRRLLQNPSAILAPHIRAGMTVVEPGPGMGFFTLELARLVGPAGKVVAVDIQPKMLASLRRRAERAGLLSRIDIHLSSPDVPPLSDIDVDADFVLAFAVVHEFPDCSAFFREASRCLKSGGQLLLAEPAGHVSSEEWEAELKTAAQFGLTVSDSPLIPRSRTALFRKP